MHLVAIGFGRDGKFEGKVIQALGRLEESDSIRLLDVLFVGRDASTGDLLVRDDQAGSCGGIIGALLGVALERVEDVGDADRDVDEREGPFGLRADDIIGLGDAIAPGDAAAFMLFEHVWARDLKNAIRGAGGTPLGEGFLMPAAVRAIAREVAATVGELEARQSEAEDA